MKKRPAYNRQYTLVLLVAVLFFAFVQSVEAQTKQKLVVRKTGEPTALEYDL